MSVIGNIGGIIKGVSDVVGGAIGAQTMDKQLATLTDDQTLSYYYTKESLYDKANVYIIIAAIIGVLLLMFIIYQLVKAH